MGLEGILVGHGELVAKAAARNILALDLELQAINGTNHAVGKVQRGLGSRVLCEIVVGLELVHELGGSDDPESGLVLLKQLALALQGASNQRLGGSVVLVGEADVGHAAWRSVGVDQDLVVALDEAVPLEVGSDLLGGAGHVAVHGASLLGLVADNLVELTQTILDGGENVGLELSKAVLHSDNIVAVVVLLDDLLVQTVVDTALENVGVLVGVDLASSAVKGGCVLAELLDVLLRRLASLVDELAALASTLSELLGLVLNLGMEALEDGQDRALDCLCGFGMRVGDTLALVRFCFA